MPAFSRILRWTTLLWVAGCVELAPPPTIIVVDANLPGNGGASMGLGGSAGGNAGSILADGATGGSGASAGMPSTSVFDAGMPDGTRADVSVMPDTAPPPRITNDLAVLYLFDENSGNMVRDTSGVQPALDLASAGPVNSVLWQTDGLTFVDQGIMSSVMTAERVRNTCSLAGGFTAEIWFTLTELQPNGPRRLLTYSINSDSRDFMLGLETNMVAGTHVVWRFLTGEYKAHVVPNVDLTLRAAHLVATHDAQTSRAKVYLDGANVLNSVQTGAIMNWADGAHIHVGNEGMSPFDSRRFRGTVHLAAIYCRALSDQEIADNFAAGPRPSAM